MIENETNYNAIVEYYNQIVSGEVRVSRKVSRIYKHIVEDIINNPDSEYKFDVNKANHALEFIEKYCPNPKGKKGNNKFKLMLWQKAMVSALFGIVHKVTGLRKYTELGLFIARKNGKTSTASTILLYLFVADGVEGAQILSGATTKEQAKLVWNEAVAMIKKSRALRKRLNITKSQISFDKTNSFFKPVASDSNTLDGYDIQAFCLDELHEVRDTNMWDVLRDGQLAREEPVALITTTMGTYRNGIFDIKYEEYSNIINGLDDGNYFDDKVLPIIYELDSEEEWTDESCWEKANPSMNVLFKSEELKRKVEKAKRFPSNKPNLLTKHFNVAQNGASQWLSPDEIRNILTFDISELKPNYGIGGVDLSKTTDLTSATFLFKLPQDNTIYVEQMYWLPEDLLERRVAEDKVPYDIWYKQGRLRLCEGNQINTKDITEWFVEIQDKHDAYLYKCGYDAWSATYWLEEMESTFGKSVMLPISQTAKTLSLPMQSLEADLIKKQINYNNNPMLVWCIGNTGIKVDENGNIKPIKGKSRTKRIDGLASLLNAYTVYISDIEDYESMI